MPRKTVLNITTEKEVFERRFYDTQVKWPIIVILQLKKFAKRGFKSNFLELNMNEHGLFERFSC